MSGENDVLVLVVETHARAWDALRDAATYREHALSPAQFIQQVRASSSRAGGTWSGIRAPWPCRSAAGCLVPSDRFWPAVGANACTRR